MFSWTLCFITNEKGAESSKILTLFIQAPLLTRDDDRRYFPGMCGVSETTMGNSRQAFATTFPHVSLFIKGDDSAKTFPVWCCSHGRVLGLFVPLPPEVLTGFPQGANISLEAGFGRIIFLSAVFVVFHSWYQNTLIPVPPSIRPT